VSMPAPYPPQMELHADLHITRWRPLVQWLLAIPHLMIAYALRFLRQILTLISFFTVLFTEQIPRPRFDAIVMTYRYEWRAMSYAFSCTRTTRRSTSRCPPTTTGRNRTPRCAWPIPSTCSGGSRCTSGSWPFPSTSCWPAWPLRRPWASSPAFSPSFSPASIPRASGASWSAPTRYTLRVEAYVGFLTDRYPPFSLAA